MMLRISFTSDHWIAVASGDGGTDGERPQWTEFTSLWDDVSAISVPTMLVFGGDSVGPLPEDVDELMRRLPSVRVETVPGAGHAVQSDQPATLVSLIDSFIPPRTA